MAGEEKSSGVGPWELSEEKLMRECRWEAYRGSGPGGQKRNKTSSAVRITHVPTGISAIAAESRSQGENRMRAMRRLRHKLAMEIRREVDLIEFRTPEWLEEYKRAGFHMAERNPLHPSLVALVMDVMKACGWELGKAAVMLGVSNSALGRFLHEDGAVWERVNRFRKELGMKGLIWDR